ncbi:hypothetical protein BUALT_Bualt10G0100200 [Buddleja alternifolia]|uniref:Protein POLAR LOCALIZATION DURING ASYMMETRIC DIVISION AND REDISTRIBUTION-like n=1 Tax=Buddleja alternifolia TaxID=168488 RepID=A0AAV6X254_9LAMI|nr:hypothetical protein BUALT_Bualt10G0100200 [Buddleja alternifolia]
MSFDGYSCDTAARGQRKRREICRSFTCVSPWFIFSRWFKGGTSRGSRSGFMERKWEKEKTRGDFDIKRNNGMVKGSINHEASSSSREDVTECDKEASFNLGVGFGLMYLIAASRNEFNKMVELHKKIEFLLQNFQTEIENQDKNPKCMSSKSSISSSYSNTGIHEALFAEEHDPGVYLTSDNVQNPKIGFSNHRRYMRREKSLRMDQLEAELEDEFDRMQLQMDEEFVVKYSKQQCSEINVEYSAPEESHSEEVVNEQHEYSNNEFYGVSSRELERKLHELLESRQQERINELESALDYAMQQLEEKETELSWWKDTARLVSQHLSDIPSLLRQAKQQPMCCKKLEFEP